MQYVKFNLDDFRYLLSISDVVEIIPYIKLTGIPAAPKYLAGLCNYRGVSTPVIDLCSLFLDRPCSNKLSTRIIVLEVMNGSVEKKIIGFMVEKATEIIKVEEDSFMEAGVYGENMPCVGPVMADKQGLISRIMPDEIFSKLDKKLLFSAAQ